MEIISNVRKYANTVIEKYNPPAVTSVVFPLPATIQSGGDCRFMCLQLADGSTGISYMDIPASKIGQYLQADVRKYERYTLEQLVNGFCSGEELDNIVAMAAINAISRYTMISCDMNLCMINDPFAGLSLDEKDTLGMVGFFRPIVGKVRQCGARLIVVERKEDLAFYNPGIEFSTDPQVLTRCNKVFITATTVLNGSIDAIIEHCSSAECIAVAGPSLGFLPDPLFAGGATHVGGRSVLDGNRLKECIMQGKPWGDAAIKTLFVKSTYDSPLCR